MIFSLKKILPICAFFLMHLVCSQNLPTGFSFVKVIEGIENISSFAFVDEDKLLIAKQDGNIYLIENDVLIPEPIVRIPTIISQSGGDRGLVGIGVDPDFPVSPYIYVTYTVEAATNNRLSRFVLDGNTIDLNSEEVLIELSEINAIWHTGGAIIFDDDGHVFTTTGDNSVPSNAQDLNTTHGKVLRINKDGSIPADNPYYTGEGYLRDMFWGIGLRNPYTMAIHKSSNTIFINDVGKDLWEEINDATFKGRNFGWPYEEGYNLDEESIYENPTYAYPHTGDAEDIIGKAITGGAFYDPDISKYPDEYLDKYFFIDFSKQWINVISPEFDGHDHTHNLASTRETFGTEIPKGGIYLTLGPDGYFYYFSRITNVLYKMIYYDGDLPLVLESPENTTTMEGGRTSFQVNVVGSETINYEWYRDGNLIGSAPNSSSYSFNNTGYNRAGTYQVRAYNDYGEVWSESFTLTVIPFNNPPEVEIKFPLNNANYQAGQEIRFEAIASDIEEGVLPAENYEWFVKFHHDDHTHDAPAFATGIKSGLFTIPNTGETSSNVWYQFVVRVKDELDQYTEDSALIYPLTSEITFETDPEGLQINIDGPKIQTPLTKSFVEHLKLPVSVEDDQYIDGEDGFYALSHWSQEVIDDFYIIPEQDETLIAHFVKCFDPENISNLNYSTTPDGSVTFTWSTSNSACTNTFVLENQDTGEEYIIEANRAETNYSYTLPSILDFTEHSFRIKAKNSYGESDYKNILVVINDFETNDYLVYPNSAIDYVKILGIETQSISEVFIYSVNGKKIKTKYEELSNREIQIRVDDLSSGLYYIKMEMNDGTKMKTLKFLKN